MVELSIIIITHNSDQVIGQCLKSIGSAFINEVLVFDNASQDNTLHVAQQFGVSTIANQKNMGFGAAANAAARKSNARYLCFLNPDCAPRPELFREALKVMAGEKGLCVVPKLVEPRGTIQEGRQPGYTRVKLFSDMVQANYGENFVSRRLKERSDFNDESWWWPHGACVFLSGVRNAMSPVAPSTPI